MNKIKATLKLGLLASLFGTAAFAQSIDEAKRAMDAEQYDMAKVSLKKITTAQPSNSEAYYQLGRIYIKTDEVDSAKMMFNKAMAADANSPLSYVGLGAIELENNNKAGAKAHFDKAISLTKKKGPNTYMYIGMAYTNVGQQRDYAAAIANLQKAKEFNQKDAEVYLALGDAYTGAGNANEAYSAYRTAFDMNKNLLKAKIGLGKIVKRSKAFKEATDEFNSVLAINPKYGPAYRELAEVYYMWAKEQPTEYDQRIKQALQYYTKYMDLTDRSLESRMRYADFLILSKDYKALEQEAQSMSKQSATNPRIYRYLGYSAFENGNYTGSIKALKDFMSKVDAKRVIPNDYMYLGKAQMKSGDINGGIASMKKAVSMDSSYSEEISDFAKALFTDKNYELAGQLYDLAVANPNSKNILYDNFYRGMAYYFAYANKEEAAKASSKDLLVKADTAFSYVITKSPTTPDSYLYRARVNRLMDDANNSKGLMLPHYEKYIEVVNAKPEAMNDERNKRNLAEAYNNIGAFYLNSNPSKAKEYFNKTLQVEPTNEYAAEALKSLGK